MLDSVNLLKKIIPSVCFRERVTTLETELQQLIIFNRMRVLSKAFGRLKLTLPWVPPDTKLSKLDTLRLATSYISHLQRVLEEEDGDENQEVATHAPVSKMDLVKQLFLNFAQ